MNREDFARLTKVTLARLEKHEQGRHGISLEDAATYAQGLASKLPTAPSKLLAELAGLPDEPQPAPAEAPAYVQEEAR